MFLSTLISQDCRSYSADHASCRMKSRVLVWPYWMSHTCFQHKWLVSAQMLQLVWGMDSLPPATSQIQKRSSVLTTMKCPSMDARQHMASLRAPGLRQQLVAPLKRSAPRRVACATATKIGSLSGARPGEMPARCWICTHTGPANHWQAAGKQRSRDAHAWARCPMQTMLCWRFPTSGPGCTPGMCKGAGRCSVSAQSGALRH